MICTCFSNHTIKLSFGCCNLRVDSNGFWSCVAGQRSTSRIPKNGVFCLRIEATEIKRSVCPPTPVNLFNVSISYAKIHTFAPPKIKSYIPNPKSRIQNPKSYIQTPKSEILNPTSKLPKFKSPNLKSRIQNPKSKIQRHWSLTFSTCHNSSLIEPLFRVSGWQEITCLIIVCIFSVKF